MSVLGEMADFISGTNFDSLPSETREHIKMHILDTVGAMLVGLRIEDGGAIRKLVREFEKSEEDLHYEFHTLE